MTDNLGEIADIGCRTLRAALDPARPADGLLTAVATRGGGQSQVHLRLAMSTMHLVMTALAVIREADKALVLQDAARSPHRASLTVAEHALMQITGDRP